MDGENFIRLMCLEVKVIKYPKDNHWSLYWKEAENENFSCKISEGNQGLLQVLHFFLK